MFKKLLGLTISTPFMVCGSAFAGEFGVSNSYNQGWRSGTGTSWSQYTTNIQQTENYNFLSAKLDCSYYGGGSGYDASSISGSYEQVSNFGGNNGFGNGDQGAPGGSGSNNGAENDGGGDTVDNGGGSGSGFGGSASTETGGGNEYGVKSIAFAMTSGTGTRTQDTTASGGSQEVYSFGQSTFDHGVSSFSR